MHTDADSVRLDVASPGPPDATNSTTTAVPAKLDAYASLDPEQLRVYTRAQRQRNRGLLLGGLLAVATLAFTAATLFDQHRPLAADAFRYKSYDAIVEAVLGLQAAHPQYVEVFTVQQRYGLPLRDALSCRRNGTRAPCEQYVVKITDLATLENDAQRPEIFFSGALHGDERVGPQAAVALAQLLVENAALGDRGSAWLRRLVRTRTVVIMPTTNAYGYDQHTREELDIDVNRDFPYLKTADRCFQSMTARAVNEVWRAHLFQLAVTWHGGTRSVSYEWGSMNHVRWTMPAGGSDVSPDDQAQGLVAMGMSRFGGKFEEDDTYYETGRMNDIVYAVLGGMEDWAYAGSWENAVAPSPPIGTCEPTTLGGYDKAKSIYGNATHRAFNVLIETSDDKEPDEAALGTPAALTDQALTDFLPSNQSIGHVPRNVRLALYYIDLLQPYIEWRSSLNSTEVGVATELRWEIGGAITVDVTQLTYSMSADLANGTTTTATQMGVTRWYHPDMGTSVASLTGKKGVFSETVTFPSAGVYYVQASATVDQNWAAQPLTPKPNVRPQSHIVNARTNDAWHFEANNRTVTGRTVWTSPIVRIVVQ